MDEEKGFVAKLRAAGVQAQEHGSEALVTFCGKIGGPEAAAHERAVIEAFKAGHVADGFKSGLKVDGDIIAHVTGHDAPAKTPVAASNNGEVRKR